MKYANILFDRNERLTIGDDIQLLAIENLYRYMGINYDEVIRIPFHDLNDYDGEYVILPISFPLYGYHSEVKITQFSDKIIPVFLALSTLTDFYEEAERVYLRRFEPVGCRDSYTMEAMRKNGIAAYLNCCMTATFPKRSEKIAGDTIYCIDVTDSLIPFIPETIAQSAKFTSHTFYPDELKNVRGGAEGKARKLLEEYRQHAKLIITSRLHAALPCVAMGIPTILAKDKISFRFSGMNSLLHVYTLNEYADIDWNPKNKDYEEIKLQMLENAAKRISEQYQKYERMYSISAYFETEAVKKPYVEFYSNTVDFAENRLPKEERFEYILWGVTQTASMIERYIEEKFPAGELVEVIDKAKRVEFCGVNTTTKEVIKKHTDAWVFVCTGAAIKESYEYFAEIGHKKFYQCCEDGKKHKLEKGFENTFKNVSL